MQKEESRMRPRGSDRNVPFDLLDITFESVPKVHIAILVNVAVLSWPERVRMWAVAGLRQVHENALPAMFLRVRDQNPQMIAAHRRAPYKRIPDIHLGSA